MNSHTFYKISNEQVYNKLLEIEALVRTTNGKVKLNRWIATTALSMALFVVGVCFAKL